MLVDRRVLARLIEVARISKDESVLEAGTGQGILTAELCKVAKCVVSYEVDKRLYQLAKKRLEFQNLDLVNADLFREKDLCFDVFASNLPYSRSRDAFEWMATRKFSRAIVMIQQEFADKLASSPGDRNYRAISALASHCYRIERLFNVGRKSFMPLPKVESVVVKVFPVRAVTKETVHGLNILFSKRNKKASTIASKMGIKADFGSKRVFQLSPHDLVSMAGMVSNVHPI